MPKKKSMSTKSRKAKGRRFQNWIAEQFSDLTEIPWGKDELISTRTMGVSGTDLTFIGRALELLPFSVEAKNQEQWAVDAAIEQAKSNQKEGTDWLLFLKKNRQNPVVVMDAEVFFRLLD